MGWLDVLNVGIDAVQLHQLSKTRSHLKGMEERQQQEVANKEFLQAFRNLIFSTFQSVEALEEHLEESPVPVYVGSQLLEWRLVDLGVTPDIFPEFSDKEYVDKTQKKIRQVKKASRKALNNDQIKKAEDCAVAIVEMPVLEEAIEWQMANDKLQETQEEWKGLNSRKNLFLFGGLGLIIAVPALSCVGSTIISALAEVDTTFVLFCLPTLVAITTGIVLLVFSSSKRYNELQKIRVGAMRKRPDKAVRDNIAQVIGEKNSAVLSKIRSERTKLIQEVMGQIEDYDRFLLAAP